MRHMCLINYLATGAGESRAVFAEQPDVKSQCAAYVLNSHQLVSVTQRSSAGFPALKAYFLTYLHGLFIRTIYKYIYMYASN